MKKIKIERISLYESPELYGKVVDLYETSDECMKHLENFSGCLDGDIEGYILDPSAKFIKHCPVRKHKHSNNVYEIIETKFNVGDVVEVTDVGENYIKNFNGVMHGHVEDRFKAGVKYEIKEVNVTHFNEPVYYGEVNGVGVTFNSRGLKLYVEPEQEPLKKAGEDICVFKNAHIRH